MTREQLEKHQVWFYLIAVAAGIAGGVWLRPNVADLLIYAPLGLLLYATFVQVPITQLPAAELFARTGPPRLVLVTCGGDFDPETGSYRANVVVHAVPADAARP
jgi:hypothetical protein